VDTNQAGERKKSRPTLRVSESVPGVVIPLAGVRYGAVSKTRQLAAGDKARVTRAILSRHRDLVHARDKKSGEVVVNITDNTRIEGKQPSVRSPRHTDMDVTVVVPGLTIEAEGVGDSNGQLDAAA